MAKTAPIDRYDFELAVINNKSSLSQRYERPFGGITRPGQSIF